MTEYTQRDRDALRKVLIAAWYRQDFGDALTAILASEWLAEHDRQVAEQAWDEGYEEGVLAGETGNAEFLTDDPNPYRTNGTEQ